MARDAFILRDMLSTCSRFTKLSQLLSNGAQYSCSAFHANARRQVSVWTHARSTCLGNSFVRAATLFDSNQRPVWYIRMKNYGRG